MLDPLMYQDCKSLEIYKIKRMLDKINLNMISVPISISINQSALNVNDR